MRVHEADEQNDKERMKELVLGVISSHCKPSSTIEDLRLIGIGLENGDKLSIEVLSGGLTNYSYKVFLRRSCTPALFAKLSFQYALWNPNRNVHYDVERTANEYKIMESFHKLKPECVAMPYLCLDMKDMKLLVTQWSPNDEQWANQMIDGTVDMRIIPKLADALATLHHVDCDPDFNTNVRPCTLSVFPLMRAKMTEFINSNYNTGMRTEKMCQEFGMDLCNTIVDNLIENYNERSVLGHSDTQPFNILVEQKPNVETFERFGENGSFTLCDWEMSFVGPIGKDMGILQAFPIACLISHALNGHVAVAESMARLLEVLWEEYAIAMTKKGVTEKSLAKIYRNSLGWNGYFLFFAYFQLDCEHMDYLPVDSDMREKVRDSAGVLGLLLLRWAFDSEEETFSLDELRDMYRVAIQKEVDIALTEAKMQHRLRTRRSSVLRASGRRVSDAPLHFPDIQRASIASRSSSVISALVDEE